MPLPASYRGLLGCQTVPMSQVISETMLRCMVMEELSDRGEEEFRKQVEEGIKEDKGSHFTWEVFTKRLEAAKIPVSTALTLFILPLTRNPAQLVLWAFTLAHISAENGYRKVMFGDFVNAFPEGVPTQEEYRRLWRLQEKDQDERQVSMTDNWLDDLSTWPLKPVIMVKQS